MCSESSSQGRLLCGSPKSILPLLLWDGGLIYGARVCAFYIHTCICSALDQWGQYLCVCVLKLLRVYLGTVIRQPRNKQNPCQAGYRGFLGGGTKLCCGESQCWSRMQNRCSVGGCEFMDKEIGPLLCSMINKKCPSPTTTNLSSAGLDLFPSLRLRVQMNCSLSSNALVFLLPLVNTTTHRKAVFEREGERHKELWIFLCVCLKVGYLHNSALVYFQNQDSSCFFFFKGWQIYHKISNILKIVLCNLQKLTFSHSRRRKWYSFVNGFTRWECLALFSL